MPLHLFPSIRVGPHCRDVVTGLCATVDTTDLETITRVTETQGTMN